MTGPGRGSAGARRPRDWRPLAEHDPVPGDPDAIDGEVEHLKRIAAVLRQEARDLKTVGEGRGLKGGYADALRGGARELEVRLRETAERYERVHGHLTRWAGELADLQAAADRMLRSARADEDAARTAHDGSADDLLAGHRTGLAKLVTHRDDRAAYYAALLRHEIDDKIKDSGWERFKDAIDDWSGTISFALDAMSWAATVISVVALAMTPAGWVLGLAVWLAVGVLAGHALLASAGDASWADVAMDVFGLLTMHVGASALEGLRGVRTATREAAAIAAAEEAAGNSARASQAARDRASAVLNSRGATRAARAKARHDRNIARAATRRAGHDAAVVEAAIPMPEASRWEAVRMGGEKESMNMHKDIERMRMAYPHNRAVQRASRGAEAYKRGFQSTWGVGSAVDVGDKVFGSSDVFPTKPSWAVYGEAKGRLTREVGTSW